VRDVTERVRAEGALRQFIVKVPSHELSNFPDRQLTQTVAPSWAMSSPFLDRVEIDAIPPRPDVAKSATRPYGLQAREVSYGG